MHIGTPTHVRYLDSASFGKADVLDTKLFGLPDILFGSKTAVQSRFERRATPDVFLAFKHGLRQLAVRRIALEHHAIEDEVGAPAGEADFMTEMRVTSIFDDDVRMRLEEGNQFLGCGNAFPVDHPPSCLRDHLLGRNYSACRIMPIK